MIIIKLVNDGLHLPVDAASAALADSSSSTVLNVSWLMKQPSSPSSPPLPPLDNRGLFAGETPFDTPLSLANTRLSWDPSGRSSTRRCRMCAGRDNAVWSSSIEGHAEDASRRRKTAARTSGGVPKGRMRGLGAGSVSAARREAGDWW